MLLLGMICLTAVAALPTKTVLVPAVGVIPANTLVNLSVPTTVWSGPGAAPIGWTGSVPADLLYHKVEFQFLDFQMNQTAPFASNLIQNIEIYVNVSFGSYPGLINNGNFSEESIGTSISTVPTSVEGLTQLYSGAYNGAGDNKINIDRTITGDICGQDYNEGYFDVWVRPTNAAAEGAFNEGYYTCYYNLNFGTSIVHEGESRWSSVFQCNSGNLNNYSFRLWYQYRFYNIESKTCQNGLFHSGI